MLYKIGETAQLAGITVRTLHYYDEIGLLCPSGQSETGYRLYNDDDLVMLQQILFFRELGFSLKKINEIMKNPDFDKKTALLSQKEILIKKKKRLDRIINTIDQSLKFTEGEITMKHNEMFKAFDMSEIETHKKQYAEEVQQRWGKTDAYKESKAKTSQYNKADWKRIMEKGNAIFKAIADLMDKAPSSSLVQQQIVYWQNHISSNFYHCSTEMLRGLGEMYIADERFTKNIDKTKKGLSRFLKKAIDYYCDHQSEGNTIIND